MNSPYFDNEIEKTDKQTKGLIPGIVTAWYTVLVAAAVIHGLVLFQDIIILMSTGYIDGAISGEQIWIVFVEILIEATALVLPVLAAKEIYSRNERGIYLAFASAGACAVRIVIIFLFIKYPPIWSIVLLAVLAVAILLPAQGSKRFLLCDKEINKYQIVL